MVPWASEINHSPVLQAIEKTLDIMLDLSWIRGPILRLYLRYDLRKRALAIAAPQNFCTRTFQPQDAFGEQRSEEHTSELQSRLHIVCRLLLEKKNK